MESSLLDAVLAPDASAPPAPGTSPSRLNGLSVRLRRLTDWRFGDPALIVGLLVISTLLRLRGIHFHYWIDEGISVGIASHPLGMLHTLLREDGAPPLWYALLHIWMSIFGTTPAATHILSLIFAQLAIPAVWWAARPLGRAGATYAAILMAGVPYLTAYSEETRMYSLMVLLSVLVAGTFLRAFVLGRRRWIGPFILSLTAAMYTHNWGLFLAVACATGVLAAALLAPAAERRPLLRDGVLALGACLVLYLPWLPTLLFQAAHTGAPWAAHTVLWTWTQSLYFIAGGRDVAGVLFVAGIGGLVAAYRAAPREGIFRREVWVLVLLTWVTFGEGWLLGKVTYSFSARYAAAMIGPLVLIVALALARSRRVAVIAVAVCCLWWVTNPEPTSLATKSNVYSVSQVAGRYLNADSLMLSTQPEQVPTLHYYFPEITHFGTPAGVPRYSYGVDWINLLPRLESHYAHTELHRLLAGVRPGETVGLVVPLRLSTATPYLKVINEYSQKWLKFLGNDPNFTIVRVTQQFSALAANPVELAVYRRR
ncbi:glycosyltransferase family 39 protein [Conexibacter sp. DBS9H8]|uniref:glycosyltransferase family 39 protein n=1 Tax=Conexibacter sp. DBS9H8 TaxID=2937801 RepID=UPI00201087B5|nr:glycosyltransferase family 39 protein [Conexibacter sp. DBS9H8]